MGVYNCASTLPDAIMSIQAQTVLDWEFIICDDGSTDETWKIASKFQRQDNRIVLLRNDKNDICAPERFEKELALYDEHPEAGVVSCSMSFFDDDGVFGKMLYDLAPQPADLLHGSQFCHAGALMRRDVLLTLGGYSERDDTRRVEDYDLWVRMYAAGYRGFNTQEILYSMRDDRNAISRRTFRNRINESKVILRAGKAFGSGYRVYIQAAVPIVKGFCPTWLYRYFHSKRLHEK